MVSALNFIMGNHGGPTLLGFCGEWPKVFFNPTDAWMVARPPRIGVGSGFDSQVVWISLPNTAFPTALNPCRSFWGLRLWVCAWPPLTNTLSLLENWYEISTWFFWLVSTFPINDPLCSPWPVGKQEFLQSNPRGRTSMMETGSHDVWPYWILNHSFKNNS